MRIRLRTVIVVVAGVGLLAVAPSGQALSSGPEIQGAYRLTSVGGQALPVLLGTDDGCRELVTAATLNLGADGKWSLHQEERHECPSGVRMEKDSERGRYLVTGTTVTFMDDDGDRNTGGTPDDDIDLEELDQGTVSGTTLNVRLKEGQALVFQR